MFAVAVEMAGCDPCRVNPRRTGTRGWKVRSLLPIGTPTMDRTWLLMVGDRGGLPDDGGVHEPKATRPARSKFSVQLRYI